MAQLTYPAYGAEPAALPEVAGAPRLLSCGICGTSWRWPRRVVSRTPRLGSLTDGIEAPPAPLEVMSLGEFEPDVWVPAAHPAARSGTISLGEPRRRRQHYSAGPGPFSPGRRGTGAARRR
jgi:hypothetical protein